MREFLAKNKAEIMPYSPNFSTAEIFLYLSLGLCQATFTDILGMKHASAKIVPKLLNFTQKQRRLYIAQEMLMTFNDGPDLLNRL